MSYLDPPVLDLKRYVDGDIYGLCALTNNNPTGRDECATPDRGGGGDPYRPKFWGYPEQPGWTGGKVTIPYRGKLVACGAIGRTAYKFPGSIQRNDYLVSPFEVCDHQGQGNHGAGSVNDVKQPTIHEYQWYDRTNNRVRGSNKQTFSACYHDIHYINPAGKLRTFGTGYGFVPAILNMFRGYAGGPQLKNGCDHRIIELWQQNPNGYGYNPDLVLTHLCCAADECIIMLDENGSVRIVQSAETGVVLEALFTNQEFKIVYFDKEDLEDNFWIDENGNNVQIENVDFVDCWTSGGGTSAQGIVVWALHRDGTLYYQCMHNMIWTDYDYGKPGHPDTWPPEQAAVLGDHVDYKSRGEPYMIKPGPYYCDDNACNDGIPNEELILNPYHGAAISGLGENPFPPMELPRDLNGYRSTQDGAGQGTERDLRKSSYGTNNLGQEEYLQFTVPENVDPLHGSIKIGWCNEAGRNALNQIPVNKDGERYKVLSLFDGYGHGGGCVAVDPAYSNSQFCETCQIDGVRYQHPDQQVEPVLLTSWSSNLHKHMYRQIHKIKKVKVVKLGNDWITRANIFGDVIDGAYTFDQELFDMLYKTRFNTYIPPRRIASTRINLTLLSNTGMVASFQGRDYDPGDKRAPLVNYRVRPGGSNVLELILDKNGSGEITGNWFYNYDAGRRDDEEGAPTGDPPDFFDDTFAQQGSAALNMGYLKQWWTGDRDHPPILGDANVNKIDEGPHRIGLGMLEGAANKGRCGFGHMPRPGQGQRIPGIIPTTSVKMDLLYPLRNDEQEFPENRAIWNYSNPNLEDPDMPPLVISYFAWVKEVGFDYEDYYWNQDSLQYIFSGPDQLGQTIYNDPDVFMKSTSNILVWHAGKSFTGERSPYTPFTENPVVWWAGQGDNINLVRENGIVDSTTYYESECASMLMPPLTLPVQTATIGPAKPPTFGEAEPIGGGGFGDGSDGGQGGGGQGGGGQGGGGAGGGGAGGGGAGGGGNPFRLFLVDDPDPSLEDEARFLILQDTEEEPGSTEGGGIDPETPDCKRGDGTTIGPDDDDGGDTIPQPKLGEIVPNEDINTTSQSSSGSGTPLEGG